MPRLVPPVQSDRQSPISISTNLLNLWPANSINYVIIQIYQ